jgi:hypothetical protein
MLRNTLFNTLVLVVLFVLPLGVKSLFSAALTPQNSVKLVLLEELRSGRSQRASRVSFKVDEDVVDSYGTVLIASGAPAYGTIIRSRKAGAWGRRGILEVEVNYTTAVDGQRVTLRANETRAGSKNKGLITAGAWLVAWPLAFIRGQNVVIKSGTTLIAWVDDNLTIGNAKFGGGNKWPDLLTLKNGDVIQGRMMGLNQGRYKVATAAGNLTLSASEVLSVSSHPMSHSPQKKSFSSRIHRQPVHNTSRKKIGTRKLKP